jgi:DNA-binding MarR family transcriptional regulator
MLANRLKRLQIDGMIERRRYSDRPRRYEYQLTDKGRALLPVMLALRVWGQDWCNEPDEGPAVYAIHQACEHDVGPGTVCQGCGAPFTALDISVTFSKHYAQERADKTVAARQDAQHRRGTA